ncbi:Major facilitator superfamily domain-containing protein 10 [Phlyctema vagabunda]|uniref:Major facilitator superfamily domain-containing protein 10 n=1 Tax=Phlyctema vagabunda TaxID=108571 RepID=A0ABR4P1F0_9HELO
MAASLTIVYLVTGSYILFRLLQWCATYYRRSIMIRANGCQPTRKYPHSDPIWGLDMFTENMRRAKEGSFLPNLARRFELVGSGTKTFSCLILGKRVVYTIEPENVKTVLATKFKDFQLPPRRKEAFHPIFGHGIFTTDGKEWEDSRALLRPNFVRSQVGDLDTFDDHISKLIARIPKDGAVVDLQELFFLLTMDSATHFLFGESTDLLSDANDAGAARFAAAFNYSQEKAGLQARVGKLANILPDKRFAEDIKFVHEYVSMYVRKAKEKGRGYGGAEKENLQEEGKASRYIFLDELAKTGYPDKKIQDELLNILLAGRDTTANLLTQLFWFLARRPDVFTKLRKEILGLDAGRPSFEQIKDMKYLKACLNETLRLRPVVPVNSRVAVVDTVLPLGGGPDGKAPLFVKAGQQVVYPTWAMHRRKDLFGEDAEEFRPERWETYRPGWEYLPFNGGPRICIGQQFALTEASYTVIRLLQAFQHVEARDETSANDIMAVPVDAATRKRVLRVVFISLLLDLVSFTFILPLFPKLLEFYRNLEAPEAFSSSNRSPTLLSHILQYLNAYKASFARPIDSRYDIVLLGGALGSLFSLLQALASPFIGTLSDRYGRRRALLCSMTGNILSVLLWVCATDFRTFLLSRVVGGLSEGNVQLAIAIATDISDEKQRGSTMALVGICFSISFTFGPALGAWLSTISTVQANPFATAAAFSLFLIVTETVYLYFSLPETLPSKVASAKLAGEAAATNGVTKAVSDDKTQAKLVSSATGKKFQRTNSHFLLNLTHLSFILFFSGMEFSLPFMTYDLFGYTSARNGRLLGYLGLVASLIQGGVTRRLSPLLSVRIGVVSCLLALFLLARIDTQGGLYLAATLLAVTTATVVTGLNALSSFEAGEDERGGKLGNLRSWGQLGRGIGPLAFTSIYWWAGREVAYTIGGMGVLGVSLVVFFGLRSPQGLSEDKGQLGKEGKKVGTEKDL